MEIQLEKGKKLYFASDFHLGIPTHEESVKRERKIVRWLDQAKEDAQHIFLIGDIFDFWFEYKTVIPKGFIRFQGKLAELTDAGIPVSFFIGNHDMWLFDYFTKELGIAIYREPLVMHVNGTKMYVGHGDGLGPGDGFYKILKKIFRNKLCIWLFGLIHPSLGITIADRWSRQSKKKGTPQFMGEEEWIYQFAKELEEKEHHDYYIFGHRHLNFVMDVLGRSKYVNTGEWLSTYSYATFDGEEMQLLKFD
ncbi:UDP-2,3-diacylglucosamine diphosphatase [Rapidithrix thailandica]|uniref:UDP-2,3-diacylglucosamine diphosphatase n=1 Tax=Rapidithrix thailandica TaxID=413964 RepID=A0AAW9S5U8_9BACT